MSVSLAKSPVATLTASGTLGAFLTAVKAAGAAIPARVPVPVLAGCMIAVSDGAVTVSGYNYETAAVALVDGATGTDGGAVLVHCKMLADMLTAAGKRATKRVTDAWPVTIVQDGANVRVDVNGMSYTLAAMDAAEYPALPALESEESVTVDAAEFIRRMDSAMVSASKDDTLPILTAIRMEFSAGNLDVLATDRYRLTLGTLPFATALGSAGSLEANFLLRAATWKSFKRHLSPKGSPIEIRFYAATTADHRVSLAFVQDGATLHTLGVDGDYPRIRSLFPDSTPITFEVSADALAAAVASVAVTAERNTPVKLTYNGLDSLRVQAGTGESATAEAFLPYVGTDGNRGFAVAFNPAYLADVLKDLKGQTIEICHTTAPKPAMIRGTESAAVKHLIMPVRMPNE